MRKTIGLLFLISGSFSRVSAESVAFVGPASAPNVGDTFNVGVFISGVTDLYAFQFDVSFDPALLSADSVSEGTFLSGGGTTFFVPGSIDNVGGSVTANADTLIGAISGVDGAGELAEFQFTALSAGNADLSFANEILLDSSLNDITADTTFESGSVTIGGGVPEPRTAVLLGVGLLALVLLRQKTCCRQTTF